MGETQKAWMLGRGRWQDIAVDDDTLSIRPAPFLARGISTIGQADELTDAEILALPGVGPVTLKRLRHMTAIYRKVDKRREKAALAKKLEALPDSEFMALWAKPGKVRH